MFLFNYSEITCVDGTFLPLIPSHHFFYICAEQLGYTPIQFAAELGHTDIVELLITADCQLQQKLQREVPHGSEDNSPDDTGGSTTPSTGESKGRSRSRSSTLNAANMFGITPLHSAVATGDAEHVRTLLRTRTGGGKRQLATACAAVDLDATDQVTLLRMSQAHNHAIYI